MFIVLIVIIECFIGGQYTNLQFQAFSLGLADQFEEVKKMYAEANQLLGDIPKVRSGLKPSVGLQSSNLQNGLLISEDGICECCFSGIYLKDGMLLLLDSALVWKVIYINIPPIQHILYVII